MGVVVDEKALGKRLQLARKRAGMTQQELCQKAGLSYSTLAKIERGAIRSPSVFTVASIAQATGAAIEDLLDLESRGLKPAAPAKKRSKSGVTFVYLDINGTIVRFFHKAFTEIARAASQPADMVETLFWRHYDSINCGQITMEDFNSALGKELGIEGFDWNKYYLDNVEPVPGIIELIDWIAANYEIGLISNSMPGSIDELRQRGLIPEVNYAAIVDSSKVELVKPDPRIYEKAQELAAVESNEILLIDDTRPNLVAADKAGWQGLWSDEMDPEGTITRIKQALEF
ncbi:MAG TPA: HAD-IA family hydrolase [Candidatus Saccharimonadales bacterium]|nr:HAD-IA family hydrolase [Candidatus Saccharimonadales bacterium]